MKKLGFVHKIKLFIIDPSYRFSVMSSLGLNDRLSDEEFLRKRFKCVFGYELDLDHPKTFNEKLQWLKLYYNDPLYTTLADKYAVKQYVASVIGEKYIIPTLGVWNCFDDIDFERLPQQFVLKCTHDSASTIIINDKNQMNIKDVRRKINKHLKRNYYYFARERVYKDIKPRVIAEKFMKDDSAEGLADYKFFCFDGIVKAMFIATDRYSNERETAFDFYDPDFNHLDMRHGHPNSPYDIPKPANFELMKKLAQKLSVNMPFVRVDFYEIGGKVFFGELTFFHFGAFVPFEPFKWDYIFGEWLTLPNKK